MNQDNKPQSCGRNEPVDNSYQESQEFLQLEQPDSLLNIAVTFKQRNTDLEFQKLRQYTETQDHEKNLMNVNPQITHLNRYSNILPYKHTVVKDVAPGDNFSTPNAKYYINASYIKDVFNGSKAYIATQGAVKESVRDFWHMIWTNNAQLIVMLCQLQEKGRSQCEQYWPDVNKSEMQGEYTVTTLTKDQIAPNLIEQKFRMSYAGQEKQITQLWWRGWPDFGVPDEGSFETLRMIAQQLNEFAQVQKRPVIHCSAGVGRTGTILAIAHVQHLLDLKTPFISIFSIVRRLREQRYGLVQTAEQYKLIYKYLIWAIPKREEESRLDNLKNLKFIIVKLLEQGDQVQGRWTREEHQRFVEALSVQGKNWKKVEEYVGTRSGAQIRSHAQKFFNRLEKEFNQQFNGLKSSEIKAIFENKVFHKYYDTDQSKRMRSGSANDILSDEDAQQDSQEKIQFQPQYPVITEDIVKEDQMIIESLGEGEDLKKKADTNRLVHMQEAYQSLDPVNKERPSPDESFYSFIIAKYQKYFTNSPNLSDLLAQTEEQEEEKPASRKQSFQFYNEHDEEANEQKYMQLKKVKKDSL